MKQNQQNGIGNDEDRKLVDYLPMLKELAKEWKREAAECSDEGRWKGAALAIGDILSKNTLENATSLLKVERERVRGMAIDIWYDRVVGDLERIADSHRKVPSNEVQTSVRKTVLQFTVLHDDGKDLSSMSLRDIGYECDEGGYVGGGLTVLSNELLTREQVDAEATKLGSDASFFDIEVEGENDSRSPDVLFDLDVDAGLLPPEITKAADNMAYNEQWLEEGSGCRRVEEAGKRVSDADDTRALSLRLQALALLQQAEALDGLKPYIVMHEHASGTSGYLAWFDREPTEEEAAAVLDAEFEPDRDETLTVESSITLDELTAASLSARLAEQMNRSYDSPSPSM